MKKFLIRLFPLILPVISFAPLLVMLWAGVGKTPFLIEGNVKLTFYGDMVQASDGGAYRVTVSLDEAPGEVSRLIVDAYSLDGRYAEVFGHRLKNKPSSWVRMYACTQAGYKDRGQEGSCRPDQQVPALLAELVEKTMRRSSMIGNSELLWSWELGTKELRSKIGK